MVLAWTMSAGFEDGTEREWWRGAAACMRAGSSSSASSLFLMTSNEMLLFFPPGGAERAREESACTHMRRDRVPLHCRSFLQSRYFYFIAFSSLFFISNFFAVDFFFF